MKIAVPVWDGSVSPVLDTAGKLAVFDIEEGQIVSRDDISIGNRGNREKAQIIADNARILLCGALSNQIESHLAAAGVEVYPWIMGDAEWLVGIFASGNIPSPEFLMPGCRGKHQGYGKGMKRWRHSHKFGNRK